MRIAPILLIALAGFISAVHSSSAADRPAAGEPTIAEMSRVGFELAWSGQAVINPVRDKLAHLTLDEELVYAQGSNGVLSAFDAETGQRRWAVRLGRFDEVTFPPTSNPSLVLAVVGQNMYGVEKRTGSIFWTLRLPGPPSTGPSMDDNQIYVGTLDGSVYAFNINRIRQLYVERRLPSWSHDAQVWRYATAKEVTSPPISTGSVVNFASRDGSMYAVTAKERRLIYQFETDAPIVAPIVREGDTAFLASEDFTFYAINAATGRVRWEVVTGLPIRTSPFAIGSALFVMPDRGGLFCLETATGEQRWWHPRLSNFISATNTVAFARDPDHNLAIIDLKDGHIAGRISAFAYPIHVANDRNDRVYIANSTGRVLAIRQMGHDVPVYHKYPDRLPLLPDFAPEPENAPEEPKPAEPAETPAQ